MTRFARAAALSLLASSLPLLGALAASDSDRMKRVPEAPTLVVYFDEWSGKLDPAALDVIAHAAKRARRAHATGVLVAGYADDVGNSAASLALTQLRAQRVADALKRDGIPASEITMKAEGAQREPGLASRRAEITFIGP